MNTSGSNQGWRVTSNEVVGDYEVFKVRRLRMQPPDEDKHFVYHTVDVPDAVQTIALTDDDRLVLVEQFRQGIQQTSVEFPAGVVDDGEEPEEAALRELKEETGYVPVRHEIIGVFAADPALNSNRITVVAAYGCRRESSQDLDEKERIETHIVASSEIQQLIRSGRIQHSNAIAAWYLFSQHASSSVRRP